MNGVYEELDEVKAENEKLRADYKSKAELADNLKKAYNDQLVKNHEANSRMEKQAQVLHEKVEEIYVLRRSYEDIKSKLNEKESILKNISAANDKLRVDSEEKSRKWEEENRRLVLALDEANEKSIDKGQKINVYKAEIEGLKGLLSASQKKCMEAERKAKAPKELRERDDMLLKLEEEHRVIEDRLKWKKEQFKHLEEAHEKLHGQFRTCKKEWELEKSTLLDEICSLQTSLDSQTRISEDLKARLERCNQALAHEETQRKYLEVQASEFKTSYEDVFAEYQDSKSQLECLAAQRDKEIAALRHSLGTKETFYKEMEYRARMLEQEKQELLDSLKELQEARIYEAGGSSLAKLRNKLKSLEQMHKQCSAHLRAKEVEWNSQLQKMIGDLNDYRSQLESKDAAIKELEMELAGCQSSAMQLKLHDEEMSVMLLVLKSAVSEAQLKLGNVEAEKIFSENEGEQKFSLLMKQLELKNAALDKAQRDIEEEREKAAFLLRRVESLDLLEDELLQMQRELARYKEMLEESSRCQLRLKEQALQLERNSEVKLAEVCDALDMANSELAEEREKVASLLRRVEHLDLIEEKQLLMQEELERYKEMLDESSRYQLHLEEQLSQVESDSKEKIREACDKLDIVNSKLAKECQKTASLMMKVESFDHVEEQRLLLQKELERCKEMLEESSRCQLLLQEKVQQVESDLKRKVREVSEALQEANSELLETSCEVHQIEFECWVWKSIAERLKVDLEESQGLRKELEASLLAQVEVGETIREEKADLVHAPEEKDSKIGDLQQQILSLEKELKWRELEAASCARMETATSFESEKERLIQITREKEKILESLEKEIGWLEQESLRRELESAVFAHISAERKFLVEEETLIRLVGQRDQKVDDLLQVVKSLEQNFNSSLKSSLLQLAEKQAQVDMVYQAWEKIARAEILAQVEIEEKKLMIFELEDDIHHILQKMEMQEKSSSDLKQQSAQIQAELELRQLEMRTLTDQMHEILRTSDASIDELNTEKRNLLEDIRKLSLEREDLLCFIVGMGDRICKLSNEDMELMGVLGEITQSFDNGSSSEALKGNGELFHPLKENMPCHPSPTMRKTGAIIEERSPFRQLN